MNSLLRCSAPLSIRFYGRDEASWADDGSVARTMFRWAERTRLFPVSSAVILAFWLSLSPVAVEIRQGKRDKKSEELAETVDVTEVQVPVKVVGKEGLPIRGVRLELLDPFQVEPVYQQIAFAVSD
jgi:hypothetical protein